MTAIEITQEPPLRFGARSCHPRFGRGLSRRREWHGRKFAGAFTEEASPMGYFDPILNGWDCSTATINSSPGRGTVVALVAPWRRGRD